jgi:SAM-dependent methyltransferase
VVVSVAAHPSADAPGSSTAGPTVVWHDLECGSYRADLPLWLELARDAPDEPILDVGAGTGRVALELARTGQRVIAMDHDPELLAALRARAADMDMEVDVQTHCADARSFALSEREEVALCVVPMQTVQLLGGAQGRLAFLRRARAHLRPDGLLACAIVTELEPFDCADGGPAPSPEETLVDGVLYRSQATRVEVGQQAIAIERERTTSVSRTTERDLIHLDRLTVAQLEAEGVAAGLHPEPARHIPPTADHSGSWVVVFYA